MLNTESYAADQNRRSIVFTGITSCLEEHIEKSVWHVVWHPAHPVIATCSSPSMNTRKAKMMRLFYR
ncbi:hypothetical protein SeMB42_g00067 [Synchytrium endobioticum]|uniref:Uncharacterized protein n=1 Tax=Synchytrium endobioticum TaxID=286115 RepID=A0A507DTA1_9FUNG|nr:hypothetical protein SeMB42_g00070 [Synchytrium endobioticum]TPX55024.1 hypothetical protein SeMB42_g00067 [Synchytrium endobioticum]